MRRAFASSLLSLLILTTLVWGGCISCEQYFMWTGAKGCCSPHGHCKTKIPARETSQRECKQIAFDHQKTVDLQVELPTVAIVSIALPVRPIEAWERRHATNPVDSSPPDLQVLHSTFLI